MPIPASNNQIKAWKKLQMGKYRKKKQLFLAEGVRCVEQIINNKKVDIAEILCDGREAVREMEIPDHLQVYDLSSGDFADISDTETPQGVIAVCRIPDEIPQNSILESSGVIVALDAIQDPGNLGTIIRTASWFGVEAIIFGTGCADPYHPKVVRSTAGATGAIPFIKGDLEELLSRCESSGWHTFLLDGSEEAKNIRTIKPRKKTILVAGNEANGIRPELFSTNRTTVRIEGRTETVESLNVALALGIGLFGLTSS
jgi:RNA methyltransferase, TrmH family